MPSGQTLPKATILLGAAAEEADCDLRVIKTAGNVSILAHTGKAKSKVLGILLSPADAIRLVRDISTVLTEDD